MTIGRRHGRASGRRRTKQPGKTARPLVASFQVVLHDDHKNAWVREVPTKNHSSAERRLINRLENQLRTRIQRLVYDEQWFLNLLELNELVVDFHSAAIGLKANNNSLAAELGSVFSRLRNVELSPSLDSSAVAESEGVGFYFVIRSVPQIAGTQAPESPASPLSGPTQPIAKSRLRVQYQIDHVDSPSAVAVDTQRECPSRLPPEPEGLDVKHVQNYAKLLFETVRAFRSIRDQIRLRSLAEALGLPWSQVGTEPSLQIVEALVNRLAGKSFGSFRANQLVAQEVQGMLSDLGLRIACPKPGCGKPATLYCTSSPRMIQGAFAFIHPGAKRQQNHGGWATLPNQLELIAIPSAVPL